MRRSQTPRDVAAVVAAVVAALVACAAAPAESPVAGVAAATVAAFVGSGEIRTTDLGSLARLRHALDRDGAIPAYLRGVLGNEVIRGMLQADSPAVAQVVAQKLRGALDDARLTELRSEVQGLLPKDLDQWLAGTESAVARRRLNRLIVEAAVPGALPPSGPVRYVGERRHPAFPWWRQQVVAVPGWSEIVLDQTGQRVQSATLALAFASAPPSGAWSASTARARAVEWLKERGALPLEDGIVWFGPVLEPPHMAAPGPDGTEIPLDPPTWFLSWRRVVKGVELPCAGSVQLAATGYVVRLDQVEEPLTIDTGPKIGEAAAVQLAMGAVPQFTAKPGQGRLVVARVAAGQVLLWVLDSTDGRVQVVLDALDGHVVSTLLRPRPAG